MRNMKKFLSWLAISFGVIYFFYETWYHISYDQSNLALTAGYISVFLLLIADSKLKIKKRDRFIMWCMGVYILYNV